MARFLTRVSCWSCSCWSGMCYNSQHICCICSHLYSTDPGHPESVRRRCIFASYQSSSASMVFSTLFVGIGHMHLQPSICHICLGNLFTGVCTYQVYFWLFAGGQHSGSEWERAALDTARYWRLIVFDQCICSAKFEPESCTLDRAWSSELPKRSPHDGNTFHYHFDCSFLCHHHFQSRLLCEMAATVATMPR